MGDAVEIVRSVYDAFARGDIAAALALFDAQIEWNEAALARPPSPAAPGMVFSVAGVGASLLGSKLNQRVDQDALLLAFAG